MPAGYKYRSINRNYHSSRIYYPMGNCTW